MELMSENKCTFCEHYTEGKKQFIQIHKGCNKCSHTECFKKYIELNKIKIF